RLVDRKYWRLAGRQARKVCAQLPNPARDVTGSLEVDEFVIAGVAEVLEEPDPGGGVEERLARERPALQIELLELIAIALHHDEFVLADALDFLNRGLQLEDAQVVQTGEGNDEIEMLVAEGVSVLRPVAEEMRADLLFSLGQSVAGYVKAYDLRIGQELL